MPGQGAKKRRNTKLAQEKQAAKRAAKKQEQFLASIPKITEDDLLNFQIKHFGDDTRPAEWFVPKERALNFAEEQVEYDNGLGYYADGVKRTLTDEQIEMFRRTELWQMKRDHMRQQEEAREAAEEQDANEGARSPNSDASSLEDDLFQFTVIERQRKGSTPMSAPGAPSENATKPTIPLPTPATDQRRPSQQSRSDTAESSGSRKQRRPQPEIPYAERNKRKWESYVSRVDDIEGSMTHRRMARELDNQQDEKVNDTSGDQEGYSINKRPKLSTWTGTHVHFK